MAATYSAMALPISLLGRAEITLGLEAALWVCGAAIGGDDRPLAQGMGVDKRAAAPSAQRAADWASGPDGGPTSQRCVDGGFQGVVPDGGRDEGRAFDGAGHGQSLCFGH
jgi:hypothetical protein